MRRCYQRDAITATSSLKCHCFSVKCFNKSCHCWVPAYVWSSSILLWFEFQWCWGSLWFCHYITIFLHITTHSSTPYWFLGFPFAYALLMWMPTQCFTVIWVSIQLKMWSCLYDLFLHITIHISHFHIHITFICLNRYVNDIALY